MLRELITWVLNTYLGKYLEDFNPQQLSVALLSGEVELENVPLRKNALRGLDLPLQILSGSVGKIKLQVPVRSFRTAPWCIIIERLYIVVGPKNLDDWDDENEKQCDLEYKLSRLDDVEAKFRAQKEANLGDSYYASSYSGWLNYGSGLAANILENLQLKINDVHIRYEDSLTIPNYRFACGITIESLSAQSCDSNWIPGYNSAYNQAQASFKLVELHAFAFYWDRLTNDTTFGSSPANELATAVHIGFHGKQHRYIIQPISAQAHFKQDRSELPLRTRSRPRLSCEVVVNQIHLSLSDFQYKQIIECLRGLEAIKKLNSHRLLRPSKPIKENPRVWWHYASKCHGFKYESRLEKLQKSSDYLRYIKIYTKLVMNPNETLSTEERQFKINVEKKYELSELKFLREICFIHIATTPTDLKSVQASNQSRSMLFQWFPSWGGWYGSNNSNVTNSNAAASNQISNTEPTEDRTLEDEILNALEEPIESNSLLKRDAVFGKFDFVLISGELNVCSEDFSNASLATMMQMLFNNLKINVETRPRSSSHLIGLSLGSVCVRDLITKDTEFPDIIKPQNKEDISFSRFQNQRTISTKKLESDNVLIDPWFELQYERKPLTYNTDYRLVIKTKSLDIVYNVGVMKWLTEFFTNPLQVENAKQKLEEMKYNTKMRLIKNWKNILEGEMGQRKSWSLEIDISAPQILFVENFCNKNTTIVIVDFGRFKLLKNATKDKIRLRAGNDVLFATDKMNRIESEDDEAFMTPCSTPPGSQTSDSPTICSNSEINNVQEISEQDLLIINENTGLENAFHDKLYDKYIIDMTDLQILVCKSKERWSFASSKGSSALHVLDRFSISLQLERRVIHTTDPEYPSVTLYGTLPKLVAHVSEQKICAITDILDIISDKNSMRSQKSTENFQNKTEFGEFEPPENSMPNDEFTKNKNYQESSLIVLQFVIDQLSLEVQSRGRSIAELQVSGVRAGLSKSASKETNVSLSVHGLLLVDAIQSFGQDFELLVASHRHVGMDSVSGSLRQSEPCSPTSPGSPDPLQDRRPTSPQTISKAISSLQRANSSTWSQLDDLDALITMEITFIEPDSQTDQQLQIANINFNNLDIIANQETIVELLGFINRVFPSKTKYNSSSKQQIITSKPISKSSLLQKQELPNTAGIPATQSQTIRTEITFDFNRLNILVLRALMRDSFLVGRKVGTFTMSEAKIHAVLSSGKEISVEGSLGGLQILDLTPEGINHQRIVSVGKDPLTEPPSDLAPQGLLISLTQEVYGSQQPKDKITEQRQALSFRINRNIQATVSIQIRMASVWYTHCARFVQELSWCATEFKHYLKNFAKSIRDKATDMAYGLVHPTDITTEQTSTPVRSNIPLTQKHFTVDSPKKPKQKNLKKVTIELDVLLETPVLVVPRSSCSAEVLVAHLGKIIVSNHQQAVQTPPGNHNQNINEEQQEIFTIDEENETRFKNSTEFLNNTEDNNMNLCEIYSIDVRNVNLFSLNTSKRKGFRLSALPRAEEFYSCQNDAVAILHDTAIRLQITRYSDMNERFLEPKSKSNNNIYVEASVTQTLQISLSRKQYEQLLETIDNIFKVPIDLVRPPTDQNLNNESLNILTEDPSSSPFDIEAQRLNEKFSYPLASVDKNNVLYPKISFTLPIFVVRLKNEHDNPLIEITFREFSVQYEKTNEYEQNVEVSLRSILMEDLLCPIDSKFRQMVVSAKHDPKSDLHGISGLSSSCPDLVRLQFNNENILSGSLPENLELSAGFEKSRYTSSNHQKQRRPSQLNAVNHNQRNGGMCPETPPPSPQPKSIEDNLVIYSALFVDSNCPQFKSKHKSMLQTSSIDFNCLSLIISVERWFLLLDFFGLFSDDEVDTYKSDEQPIVKEPSHGNTGLEITVRSLNLTLVRNDVELAKANVSNAFFVVSKFDQVKVVEGSLGSVSLYDLTNYGKVYRERFLTSGTEALNFIYKRDGEKPNQRTLNKDATLNITMSSVRYVHTKRFIMELQEFVKEFLQLQTSVMKKIKLESKHSFHQRPTQLGIKIIADSPIILLPLSFENNQVIVVDLGEFSLSNSFHLASEKDIISKKNDKTAPLDEILDVMQVDLFNTNLFTGNRICKKYNTPEANFIIFKNESHYLDMGSYWITKQSKSLLKEKCHLKLQIERNMDSWKSHNCPDVSVQGTLSRVESVIGLEQYKLIRGFLAYNLGEPIDDVYTSPNSFSLAESKINLTLLQNEPILPDKFIWTNLSINLDLEDVLVVLTWKPDEFLNLDNDNENVENLEYLDQSLACINFIKSCLKIDSFSDGSQDIDLVSQEILITDSRFVETQQDFSKNVFTNILQPIRMDVDSSIVQAEIHSRKRNDNSKYTVLLNNMRLMAIIDWIENVRDFISQTTEAPNSLSSDQLRTYSANDLSFENQDKTPFELVLNITDSELVFVEKTNQMDTNAVILKSTTVVSFKPLDNIKPMSINLNNLEVFSCVLGYEDETALSIIDPITINLDLKDQQIEIQIQKEFCIRLSYHDVKMFTRMLQSLPKQTRKAQNNVGTNSAVNSNSNEKLTCLHDEQLITKLKVLGFNRADCIKALQISQNHLDDAALWLTQNREANAGKRESDKMEINSVLINAQCISIFVIDDCKDADVPLLEISLSQLIFKQELSKYLFSSFAYAMGVTTGFCKGHLRSTIACDYYNRNLSGWESILEPWECCSDWNYSLGQIGTAQSRLNLSIQSDRLLKFNVTSTLIELWQLVRTNWTQDYYEGTSSLSQPNIANSSPTGYRRRTPFVPFSLKNNTGVDLLFKILLSQPGGVTRTEISSTNDNSSIWLAAKTGETIPFSFTQQNKLRHMDSHKLNLHQVMVHVAGWSKVGPVSVDKVGVFFRHAHRETTELPDLPKARIVFAVTLEGSAQKLVTVRSSLKIQNQLEDAVMLKMDHPPNYLGIPQWPETKTALILPKEIFCVPLCFVNANLYFKPVNLISSTDEDNSNTGNTSKLQLKYAEANIGLEALKHDFKNRFNGNEYWQNERSAYINGKYYQFHDKSINWRDSTDDISQEQRICKGNRDKYYNIVSSVKREGYPQKEGHMALPGHTINLLPPLRIYNLLCCDLLYKISNNVQGRLQASETANIHEINLDSAIQLNITLDGYKVSGQLLIPAGHLGTVEPKLRLMDTNNRDLHLRISIQAQKGNGIEIFISAPYWLVNKTGLPLIFRQEGCGHLASGQFEEHEKARVVTPLMFSFSDADASPALEIRLGNRYGQNSPWCQGISLYKQIVNRQLKASQTNETFAIGAEVRRGRGRLSRTSVVTFSPRFQLFNRSSHKLQFVQQYFIIKPVDPDTSSTIIDVVPESNFLFHWPRSDQEPLLCVRLADIDYCYWSSGIPINEAQSLYITCRTDSGDMYFLRLEVILQGATYFLVFGDANTLPPPIRVDNFSEVPMKFFQYNTKPEWRTTVKPHSSVAYAFDDPLGSQCIQIEAPGGDSYVYSLRDLNFTNTLTYSNFIYIAFKGTFVNPSISENLYMVSEFEQIENQHLVLGVRDKKVILMRKCAGDRSQLWLMNSYGQLEHEGSSPPTEPGKNLTSLSPRFVLDLEKAPNPMDYTCLVIRPPNKQKESTQTWKFINYRLMCGHANMCVQARNGIYGLRPGSEAVLGRIESDTRTRMDESDIPIDQFIERQKLRPGSGQLSIVMRMDGPIKTIQIRDVKAYIDCPLNPDPLWRHASHTNFSKALIDEIKNNNEPKNFVDEYHIKIKLAKGVGISIISRRPSVELAYITLEKIYVETVATSLVNSIDLNVGDIQIENQLLETPCPILLYTMKSNESNGSPYAIAFNAKMLPSPNKSAVIFERMVLSLKPFILYLEERLILRCVHFFGFVSHNQTSIASLTDESEFEAQQVTTKILAANAKRYYFENLLIGPSQIRLSVITASKLSPQLSDIKKKLALTLIKFEDAVIDFDKFSDRHHFETLDIYLRAIKNHYKNLLKWQAGSILGSVDFLGNPLGFANDLSEGVSGLIFEGSVKSLVKNVTHGISNSTAKLTETLSDGLGRVVLDEQDHDTRQKILEVVPSSGASTSGEHLAAGLKGLGFGLLGGVTSIVKYTYEGAQTDGFHGFLGGLGKGLLGTITKPLIGVLDLASETANAVRETSKSAHRILPERKRLPRCLSGAPGGLLPQYSSTQAKGQQHLYLINKRNFLEQLMSYEPNLFDDRDSKLRLLVSTEYVRIFSRTEEETTIILQIHLSEVVSCHPVCVDTNPESHKLKKAQYYVEILSSLPTQYKRPRVRCQTEEMAEKASRHINYAKSVYDEREHSLNYDNFMD